MSIGFGSFPADPEGRPNLSPTRQEGATAYMRCLSDKVAKLEAENAKLKRELDEAGKQHRYDAGQISIARDRLSQFAAISSSHAMLISLIRKHEARLREFAGNIFISPDANSDELQKIADSLRASLDGFV